MYITPGFVYCFWFICCYVSYILFFFPFQLLFSHLKCFKRNLWVYLCFSCFLVVCTHVLLIKVIQGLYLLGFKYCKVFFMCCYGFCWYDYCFCVSNVYIHLNLSIFSISVMFSCTILFFTAFELLFLWL